MLRELGHLELILAMIWPALQGFLRASQVPRGRYTRTPPVHTGSRGQSSCSAIPRLSDCLFGPTMSRSLTRGEIKFRAPAFYRVTAMGGPRGCCCCGSSCWAVGTVAVIAIGVSSAPGFSARLSVVWGSQRRFLLFMLVTSIRLCARSACAGMERNLIHPAGPALAIHLRSCTRVCGVCVAFAFAVRRCREQGWTRLWARWTRPGLRRRGVHECRNGAGKLVALLRVGVGRLLGLGPVGNDLLCRGSWALRSFTHWR